MERSPMDRGPVSIRGTPSSQPVLVTHSGHRPTREGPKEREIRGQREQTTPPQAAQPNTADAVCRRALGPTTDAEMQK
jgi:hypothetical protein